MEDEVTELHSIPRTPPPELAAVMAAHSRPPVSAPLFVAHAIAPAAFGDPAVGHPADGDTAHAEDAQPLASPMRKVVVGEIISRFEKKGFYLKGEDFTNCNPFFVFPVFFREETRNFLGYFCASIKVEVGRRGMLLCGETLCRPLHEALLWFPCGVHHLWSGGSDGMDAKECGGQTMQLRLVGSMMLPSNMVTTMLIEGLASVSGLTRLSCFALQPNHPQALPSLDNIYMDCNMMSVVASFYKATLAVTTGISAPFNNLAIIYKQQTDADGLVNRGNTFKEIGRVTEAIQDYIRAVNIRPTILEAHANLSSAYKDSLQISSTPELKLMKCGSSGLNAC
ncbi:hypothetical protein ZIOFF_006005 [Zingiber officinale]|uniref:Uncharacterized protein n=1 Tax=Zingiber officinale TaxID=94328 RepID=A0A8J5LV98_ZINOF|nr:hypothetical protein ZIOFF_006005 [Zingiber officinale]